MVTLTSELIEMERVIVSCQRGQPPIRRESKVYARIAKRRQHLQELYQRGDIEVIIVKPWSKSKPLLQQTPKLNKSSPKKKEKRRIWTKG